MAGPIGIAGTLDDSIGIPAAVGNTAFSTVAARVGYLVETRKLWSGTWIPRPEVFCSFAEKSVASVGGWRAEFSRRYGPRVKDPGDTYFKSRTPLDLLGHWVQIKLLGNGTAKVIWCGRIYQEPRRVDGVPGGFNSPGATAQGVQHWIADGPDRVLERVNIFESWHETGSASDPRKLEWTPDFNEIREAGTLRGNRSFTPWPTGAPPLPAGSTTPTGFTFGGDSVWDNQKIVEYLLGFFVNLKTYDPMHPTLPTGPRFKLGGVFGILAEIKEFVQISDQENLYDLLRKLIPPRYGLDFLLVEVPDITGNTTSFEVRVFTTSREASSFGGFSVPDGPTMIFDAVTTPNVECQIQESFAERYDRIRVQGERIVSCFSGGTGSQNGRQYLWGTGDVSAYIVSRGSTNPDPIQKAREQDDYRASDRFKYVFSGFSIGNWSWQSGKANPLLGIDGSGITLSAATAFQNKKRRTLTHLPLREGFDYSVYPPVDRNATGTIPSFNTAFAIAYTPDNGYAALVNFLGGDNRKPAHVRALDDDLGVLLEAHPRHAFAYGVVLTDSAFIADISNSVDYNTVGFTIAAETDHRVAVESALPPGEAAGDGSVLVIQVPDAHFWWLAPQTILGPHPTIATQLLLSPQSTEYTSLDGSTQTIGGMVLRDDRARLMRIMAGAIGRYQQSRRSATIAIRQLVTTDRMLGKFLDAVQQGPDSVILATPVTSVTWNFDNGVTTLLAGQCIKGGNVDDHGHTGFH